MGCFESKQKTVEFHAYNLGTIEEESAGAIESEDPDESEVPAEGALPEASPEDSARLDASTQNREIYIVYYSLFGHIQSLVQSFAEGVQKADLNLHVRCFQVAETLCQRETSPPTADPPPEHPFISPNELPKAAGALFQQGELNGKPVSLMTSTASQEEGQDAAIMEAATHLARYGMLVVPLGAMTPDESVPIQDNSGSSPWGTGTLASPSEAPSKIELALAERRGVQFASTVAKLVH